MPPVLYQFRSFQSTHPRGVRLYHPIHRPGTSPFQSTHPRGVRQELYNLITIALEVSIHAPTRGATLIFLISLYQTQSFNPRTHAGCDYVIRQSYLLLSCFNPRTHAGCDFLDSRNFVRFPCFNPRTHAGCDVFSAHLLTPLHKFQSTHPRGVRHHK